MSAHRVVIVGGGFGGLQATGGLRRVSRGGDTRRAAQGSDDGGDASRAPLADSLGPRLGPAATFATTEHFNLQTARALTVSEANGRASIYLAALSGNLIALAFVG